ncbi:hypothetical protein ACIBCN_01665 [Nocardia sp. NPDC051052]|uniref:hypothetical protein n=1 Tax=Nocardia sp. NPDC051052 TaxID=3364322 RepID=UPI0037952F88
MKRSDLGAVQQLAAGGQGVVYTAPNAHMAYAAALVFKEYKPQVLPAVNVAALEAMPAFLESLPFTEGIDLLTRAAWPCRLVEEDASPAVIGFVMPSIPSEYFITMSVASGTKSTTAEFQHLLNDDNFLARRNIALTDRHRYELLIQAAKSLVTLHGHQIAIGDLSPKNLLFSLQPDRKVYIIDCDAMRLGSRTVANQVETPDWEVRAANPGEELATPQSDAYKLGLLVLRLLAGDQSTRDADRLPSYVPTAIRRLTEAALSPTPASRPTPAEWVSALTDAVSLASTQPPQTTTPITVVTGPVPPTHLPWRQPVQRVPVPPSGQVRRGPSRRWRLTAVAVVAALAAAGVLLFDRGGSGSGGSGGSGGENPNPEPAVSLPSAKCAVPPKFSVARTAAAGESLDVTLNIVAGCPDGDVLSSSHTQVTISMGSDTVASAAFDLAAAPVPMPSSSRSTQRVFRFPAGQFWRSADTLPTSANWSVAVDESGSQGILSVVSSSSGGVVTAAAAAAPPDAGYVEAMSLAGLQSTAEADRSTVLPDLADRWVPQLSSKRFGLVAEGVTWHHAEILREHLLLRQQYPNIRLLWSGAWSTFNSPDFWITIAGTAYQTPEGAIQWCADHGFDRDHCYAKLISTTHPIEGSTRYQP